MKRGLIIVVSAPSGSGKTTICDELLRRLPGLCNSISVTTRSSRGDEAEGKDYFFVSREEFQKKKKSGEFVECAEILGEYYGTPVSFLERMVSQGKDVLLNIDVQGQRMIKKENPDAVSIFILPPSMGVLEGRLKKRKTENEAAISKRLKLAKREMGAIENYDYVVINRNIDTSVRELRAIISAEKHRVSRLKKEIDDLRAS